MSDWSDVFLGVIAVATLAIAIVQIGVLVAAGLLARRVGRLVDQLEREVKPLFGHLNAIGRDASRAAALAPRRSSAPTSCSPTSRSASSRRSTSSRRRSRPRRAKGRAMMSAFRAALQALRDIRSGRGRQGRGDDEDALFI